MDKAFTDLQFQAKLYLLGGVHIEAKPRVTLVSPPHLVMLGQAQVSIDQLVHTAIYSELYSAVCSYLG